MFACSLRPTFIHRLPPSSAARRCVIYYLQRLSVRCYLVFSVFLIYSILGIHLCRSGSHVLVQRGEPSFCWPSTSQLILWLSLSFFLKLHRNLCPGYYLSYAGLMDSALKFVSPYSEIQLLIGSQAAFLQKHFSIPSEIHASSILHILALIIAVGAGLLQCAGFAISISNASIGRHLTFAGACLFHMPATAVFVFLLKYRVARHRKPVFFALTYACAAVGGFCFLPISDGDIFLLVSLSCLPTFLG